MAALYHRVPEPMVGSVLYPLNELRERDPETWARQRAKYEGREQVLDMPVPLLDCLWNDVLHLSPVHPRELVASLEAAGFRPEGRRFLEVDAGRLDPERTVVFRNSTDREHRYDPDQWAWFQPALVAELAVLRDQTRDYFVECAREGWRPLLFAYVPHVLFRGSLDVSGVPVVEV